MLNLLQRGVLIVTYVTYDWGHSANSEEHSYFAKDLSSLWITVTHRGSWVRKNNAMTIYTYSMNSLFIACDK